jgi:hypothetical protein
MSFQTVFDNATSIKINKKKKVSSTTSRSGVVKSTSLGGQVWEFEVQLPDGPRYSVYRPLIEAMERYDRVTTQSINISQTYITGYQGTLSSVTGGVASFTSGNTITITSGLTGVSGYRFKAGDLIQLGSGGSVYSVAQDVVYNQNTVVLNRPVRESAGSYSLIVGPSVSWEVLCVSFPDYTVFGYDQVSWSGPFVFVEAI